MVSPVSNTEKLHGAILILYIRNSLHLNTSCNILNVPTYCRYFILILFFYSI